MNQNTNIYELVIVGGGPAGMSAGVYAARKKLKTLLLAKNLGGQPSEAWQIDNYLGLPAVLGIELAEKFKSHLKKFSQDIEIKEGEIVVEIKKTEQAENNLPLFNVYTEKEKFPAKALIIATGVSPKKLGIPGEEKFTNRGVVFCATCDAPLFKDKIVAVVGSGNAGLDAAIQLTSYAKKIYLLNKYPDLHKGDLSYVEKIEKSPLIGILNNALPKEIKGDKFVKSLVWENVKTKETQEIEVEGVFVEIGSAPSLHFAKQLLKYNEKNEIIINPETNATSCPGIFAAGDVTNMPYKQIIISAGEGAKAALSAYYYLTKT
jgi:alkyl hydroperoxide reductase subunit F